MKKKLKSAVRWLNRNPEYVLLSLIVISVMLIAWHAGEASVLAAVIVPGVAGGEHVGDEPLTTDITRDVAPGLLLNEVDQQIVKIRPMATPVDQLSRYAGCKHAGSMIVDYYNVDTKETHTMMADDYDEPSTMAPGASVKALITPEQSEIFDTSDTVLVQGVLGYEADGVTPSARELVLYVTERNDDGIVVMAINGKRIGSVMNCVPSIPAGATLVRMGRAASELDVMSPQFEALPRKEQNFCQIFKMNCQQI